MDHTPSASALRQKPLPHEAKSPPPIEPHEPRLYAHDAVAEPVVGLEAITDQHLETYRSQGFLAVDGAFDVDRVGAALQAMDDLVLGRVEGFDGVQFEAAVADRVDELTREQRLDAVRKFMWFVEWDARLKALAEDPALLGVVRRLMGGREPRLFQDMGLIKPPRIGREKPWHQDCAYFDLPVGTPVVGVWIALDEATVENGCMRMLAGGHLDGPVPHWQRRDWQICDTDLPRLRGKDRPVIAAPLKPGGLLLFDGMCPHGTPHNHTDERRRALQYHYCPADAEWTTQEQRLAVWGTEGKDVEC